MNYKIWQSPQAYPKSGTQDPGLLVEPETREPRPRIHQMGETQDPRLGTQDPTFETGDPKGGAWDLGPKS